MMFFIDFHCRAAYIFRVIYRRERRCYENWTQ
jgi:hypothetical protein